MIAARKPATGHLEVLRGDVSRIETELQRAVKAEGKARRAVNTLAKRYLVVLRRYREELQRAVRLEQYRQSRRRRLSRECCLARTARR